MDLPSSAGVSFFTATWIAMMINPIVNLLIGLRINCLTYKMSEHTEKCSLQIPEAQGDFK